MTLSYLKLLLFAVAIESVAAQDALLSINYYSDQGCTNYMESVNITTGTINTCVSYNIPGAGSFNVANSWANKQYYGCQCGWFPQANCQGTPASAGVLSDGNALNSMMSNPSEVYTGNCANTAQVNQEPVSLSCSCGFYIN